MPSVFRLRPLVARALVLLACIASFAVGWTVRLHHLPAPLLCDDVLCAQIAERSTAVGDQIAAAGTAPRYLAIGDSLTEGAELPVLCGRVGINAGISGATTQTFLPRARGLAAAARPDFVLLGLGTNDALRGQEEGFADRLATLVRALAGYRVILVPASLGPRVPHARDIDAVIAGFDLPKARPVPADDRYYLDGVHYAPAGQTLWDRAVADAVAAALPAPSGCSAR